MALSNRDKYLEKRLEYKMPFLKELKYRLDICMFVANAVLVSLILTEISF